MSSSTFETARVFPQQQISNRFETRHIKGGSSASSFYVSEVDNGKFLSVSLGTGRVSLVLPPAQTAVGVRISGAVVASHPQSFFQIVHSNSLTLSYCIQAQSGLSIRTFSGGVGDGLFNNPMIKEGSTFTAWCTGSRWVFRIVLETIIPVNPNPNPAPNPDPDPKP
jgi:hypothetical protein